MYRISFLVSNEEVVSDLRSRLARTEPDSIRLAQSIRDLGFQCQTKELPRSPMLAIQGGGSTPCESGFPNLFHLECKNRHGRSIHELRTRDEIIDLAEQFQFTNPDSMNEVLKVVNGASHMFELDEDESEYFFVSREAHEFWPKR